MTDLQSSLRDALARRETLFEELAEEGTDVFRLYHGTVEGVEGLTVDRYGPQLLIQSFRAHLEPAALEVITAVVAERFPGLVVAYNHRGRGSHTSEDFALWHEPDAAALEDAVCQEIGVRYRTRLRHRGIDPLLFVDFRAVRRWLLAHSAGRSVLNLFAYTCGAGVCAAVGGASEVWNVDFAASALEVGEENAALNGVRCDRYVQEDIFPILRQLAGLPLKGRGYRRRRFTRVEPRRFDCVVLDPPTFSRGPFGAVDIVRDYQSLFKPALLATASGGVVVATNHAASVAREVWVDQLERCAQKAGRPLAELSLLEPEADVPSYDGNHPLKIALCRVP